jgi:hemoglobin-like flavoprotein
VAPTEAAVAQEHAHMLVSSISTNGLSEMRQLRDELDDLMKEMGDRRDLLAQAILAHAQFIDAAVAHKRIITDHVAKMRAEFAHSTTPLPPAPQLNGRRGR